MTRASEVLKKFNESAKKDFMMKDPSFNGEPTVKTDDGTCLISFSGRGRNSSFWTYCDISADYQEDPAEYKTSYDAEMALKKKGKKFNSAALAEFNDYTDSLL